MSTITLNNEEFNFTSYNRNTYFSADSMSSSGYIGGLEGANLATRLQALAQTSITSITIKKEDETVIYSLQDIDAHITNIDESYNGIDMVITNLNLQFN